MHRLKALLWRSYKVRVRSIYTTLLDLLGPIVIISIHVAIKMLFNVTHQIQLEEATAGINYFHSNPNNLIDLKRDIRLHMCHKVLFYSQVIDAQALISHLTNHCGLEITPVSSRSELVQQLKLGLDLRVAYSSENTDLNKKNSSDDNCIKLPPKTETIFQLGLIQTRTNSFELHMTDSAGSSVIHMPYSQGSTYNEYKMPHSDLNLGTHLIEICLADRYKKTTDRTPSKNPTTTGRKQASVTVTERPNSSVSTSSTTLKETQTRPDISTTTELPVFPSTSQATDSPPMMMASDVKWLIYPYPVLTGVYVLPITTSISIMLAFFCSNIATVLRISEANESGLHRYARLCGLPAYSDWLSLLTLDAIQNLIMSLVIAIMLGIPTGSYIYDPLSEAAITVRWLLLLTYGLAATSHSIMLASLFERSSHALLTLCMLASMYAMQPLLLIQQWTPYGFMEYPAVSWLSLLNPAGNFEALCAVIIGVALQTSETFGWSKLSGRIIGGGFSDLSVSELWILLLLQIVFWIAITTLIDQYRYSSTSNIIGFLAALLSDLFCCNYCRAGGERTTEDLKTKSLKSSVSKINPNRICCSLRHVYVSGKTTMIPYNKGNPLKLTEKQLKALNRDERTISKTTQFLVNRMQPAGASLSIPREEPIMIDEAIKQSIIWYKTHIRFEELTLDFRFNQISFVLGQTDLKELLFETLLGLRPLDGGHIIIDGTRYSASTMGLARHQIGYLSEKDIFNNDLSIFENLQFYGSLREPAYKIYDSESLYVLSLLHLSSRKDDLPATLTHRSARKLALAVALVGYTKLLLLTEPTMNLRWRPRCQVHNMLKKYKSIRSIVIDTFDVDEAVSFGDRIVLLKNGTTDLNDAPRQLIKKLACGYWLVFEPTTGQGSYINAAAIRALERLTSDIFKQDKLDLDATKQSIYQDITGKVNSKVRSRLGSRQSSEMLNPNAKTLKTTDDLQRQIVIVKVQHSSQSSQSLCTILKMFANKNIHGFRLARVSYESLEDILVLRMSRANYPDLPPDLLLSLQHRALQSTKTRDSPISVRNMPSGHQGSQDTPNTNGKQIFVASMTKLLRDRLSNQKELLFLAIALVCSLIIVIVTLLSLKQSFRSETTTSIHQHHQRRQQQQLQNITDHLIIENSAVTRLYKYRIGFYILENRNTENNHELLQLWPGNRNLVGLLSLLNSSNNKSSALIVANLIDKSQDVAGSLIVFDPDRNEVNVIFEPHLPSMLLATIKTFIDFSLSLKSSDSARSGLSTDSKTGDDLVFDIQTYGLMQRYQANATSNADSRPAFDTSRHDFHHSWHEMIQGLYSRRLLYGIGFAIAEAINVGALVMAPLRHRSESGPGSVGIRYWLKMAVVDLCYSALTIIGYIMLFIIIEGFNSASLIYSMVAVLFLYKLASLPIPYMTSLVTDSSYYGFLFIVLLYVTVVYDMAMFIRAFIDWTLISNDYSYTVANWILSALPITPLIDSLVVISQMNVIKARCPQVPAYTATSNTVHLDGIQRYSMVDSLLEKVSECLASGKTFVSTDVMHRQRLGILWNIYLISLFGAVSWTFLLTCERLFGLIVRRFSSNRTTNDPMKTVIRLPDQTMRLFVWDKERDRLISEYIKCVNELKYVKMMARNCLILRIWLKPMDANAVTEVRLANILEPLVSLGHAKNDCNIELRTTLQVFIRIGNETSHCRVDKINLIDAYTRYVAGHSDTIAKFAVVDWSRENLYKILLHGHYNNKTATTDGS